MYDDALNAAERMVKARTQLLLDDVFWGSLSVKLIPIEDIWGQLPFQTIATDGKYLLYDKKYIESLTVPEIRTEIAHECGHLILKHHLRREDRDWSLWNIACDQAVDWILHKAKFQLAPKWRDRLDPEYENDNAEMIYAKMLAKQKASQKTGQQPGAAAGKNQNQNQNQASNQSTPGQGPPSAGSQAPSGSPPPSGQNTAGNQPPSSSKPSPASGSNNQSQTPSPQIQNAANAPLFPNINEPVHGLICDAPIDFKNKADVDDAEQDIDIALEAAGKLAGNLPGALEALVTANKVHQINYKALLRDFLEKTLTPGDYDWIPPDRNYLGMDIIVPGIVEEEELPNVLFACDSSGSIGPAEKKIFANEICGVLEDFPCTITVVYCDTTIQGPPQEITAENYPIKLHFKGGGGTRFSPVFKYIKDEQLEPKAVLYFTDLCVNDWGEDPGIPVLWMNTYRPNDAMEVPFGKVIPLELTQAQQAELELEFA